MDHPAKPKRHRARANTRPGTRYASWLAHAAALALVAGYIGLSAFHSTPDANIGLGLGLLALGAMGAPWSVPLFMSDGVTVDSGLFLVVATGGAMLNLVLHAVALGRWRDRSGRRQ